MKLKEPEKDRSRSARGIIARVLLGVCSWLIVSASVMFNMIPAKHTLEAGDLAPEDIQATRDVVDTVTTRKKAEAAAQSVNYSYRQDDAVTADVMSGLEQCYEAFARIRENGDAEIKKMDAAAASGAYRDEGGNVQFTAYFLRECHELLPGSFTDEDVRYIILADRKKLEALEEMVTSLVSQALHSGIKEDNLGSQINAVNNELISPLNRLEEGAQRLGMNLVSTYLKANFIYDAAATEQDRQEAYDRVMNEQPELYKKGQNITRQHEIVTEAQIQVLKDLGMLSENEPQLAGYAGIGAFTALVMLVLWLYMLFLEKETFASFRRLLLLHTVFVLTVGALWLGKSVHYYFLLTTAGVLLVAVLINNRLALTVNAVLALFAGILAGSEGTGVFSSAALPAAIASFTGGTLALLAIRGVPHRSTLMLAGILSGVMAAAVFVSVDLISMLDWQVMLQDLGAGLGGGLVSAMLCLGTLPLWEWLFRVVTPMKLLELANPNHPLLKRLLIEAPGTYHHSIVVGNLAESAAEAIGANALLTRTGAYYHDVGKLLRPYFFTENQIGSENPHESITPDLSRRILTAHTKDGVELAAKAGLPQPVQDIILEHHGTTPVMYFYHKAVKLAAEGDAVSLDDYRYSGPKPHTREAAIIMLADSIEAGTRALKEHTQEKLDEFVQHIVNTKLEDGQFGNCDLTLRDIGVISADFRKTLGGIFHERVVYPSVETGKKENGIKW